MSNTQSFSKPPSHAAFRHRDFRFFLAARFPALCAHQMMIVAVSQALYEITRNPLHLGYIGLALFAPRIGLTLLAGHTADRFDRRLVILICRSAQCLLTIGLIAAALTRFQPLWILFALLVLMGTAYAFDGPASQSIVTQVVPAEYLQNAVTWNSAFFQAGFIVGPALGGWSYAALSGARGTLIAVALLRLISTAFMWQVRPKKDHIETSEISWKTALAGVRYVFENRVILGAISLDLFAVLLGGAVALMPVYANDILKVGPMGLGLMRSAPAVGAAVVAILLAFLPPLRRAGKKMFFCVALFGAATIIFGISRNFILSLFCLAVLGGSDMVSVVIRHVLVQAKTPAAMRGRVSAVNLIFIGASNELGEFESGLTASWFGTVPAVVVGGLGTLAVVGLWMSRFPELRDFDRLDETAPS